MTYCKTPCIICNKKLKNLQMKSQNHPSGGNEVVMYGHYGSTVVDDGTTSIMNLCDECIKQLIEDKKVLLSTTTIKKTTKLTLRKQ